MRTTRTPETFREALGLTVREYREAYGMTNANLAEAMGVSAGTISKIESGKQSLYVEQIVRLAEIFGLEPSIIFSNAEQKWWHA